VLTIDDIFDSADLSPLEQVGIEGLDTRSVAIIPLRTPQRAIGAIWIGSREAHIHRDREERIYQAFSESASLSMEASYLIQQTERRARQLETSAEVSRSAGSLLELEVLLPRVVQLIREAFGYDHTQIFMMDERDEYAVLSASTGEAGRMLLTLNHKLAKGSGSVVGMVTATGEPQIALDTTAAGVVHAPNPYLPYTRSEMALPLILKGQSDRGAGCAV
jgi:transcriptional regulator with GAF, ATPase, and Fis domain